MSESSYFDGPDLLLEQVASPHLTGVEWDALSRLAPLMKSATPDALTSCLV